MLMGGLVIPGDWSDWYANGDVVHTHCGSLHRVSEHCNVLSSLFDSGLTAAAGGLAVRTAKALTGLMNCGSSV